MASWMTGKNRQNSKTSGEVQVWLAAGAGTLLLLGLVGTFLTDLSSQPPTKHRRPRAVPTLAGEIGRYHGGPRGGFNYWIAVKPGSSTCSLSCNVTCSFINVPPRVKHFLESSMNRANRNLDPLVVSARNVSPITAHGSRKSFSVVDPPPPPPLHTNGTPAVVDVFSTFCYGFFFSVR